MKKLILFSLLSLIAFASRAQFAQGVDWSDTSQYFIGYQTSVRIDRTHDIDYKEFYFKRVLFSRLSSTYNDGTPTSINWSDASGNIKRSPISTVFTALNLSNVSITGAYSDLTGKPTIPAATPFYHNATSVTGKIETFSGSISGGAGNLVFYLTDTGTSGGTALFTNVNFVVPIVNDATTNYTYGWTVSGDKKTLTVNVKATPVINVAVLSLNLLGVPANAPNGTVVTGVVIGN